MIHSIAEMALIQETAALQTTNPNKMYIDKMKQTHSQATTVLTSTCLIALRKCKWPNNDTNQVPGIRWLEILSLALSIRMQPSGLWSHQCKFSTPVISYLLCAESWHSRSNIQDRLNMLSTSYTNLWWRTLDATLSAPFGTLWVDGMTLRFGIFCLSGFVGFWHWLYPSLGLRIYSRNRSASRPCTECARWLERKCVDEQG